MEAGMYVTFFDPGEAFERELPPVGPLDHVVVRHRDLVVERRAVAQAPEIGADIARWLEAELELQRATNEEPGGVKRTEMRFAARDGLYLRFAVFGDSRERDLVPELGPYALVVVGRRGIEADGQLLATRTSSDLAAWELTSNAGRDLAGLHKPDVAFRTTSTGYHAQIAATPARTRPVAEPVFAPAARPTPPPPEPPALTPADLELIQRIERQREEETLRARMQEEERRRLGVDESDDEATTWAMRYRPQPADQGPPEVAPAGGGLDLGALLWRMRLVIIGILLLGVGAYGFTVLTTRGATTLPGQQPVKIVNVAQKVSSARWDYVVNGTQRAQTAGSATPRGVYYVVRIGVTNRGTDGAQLSPSEFTLIDATGIEYRAESVGAGAYYGSANAQSQFVWPQSFAVGRAATLAVVFDVDPGLGRGMQLAIADLPNTRVKLD